MVTQKIEKKKKNEQHIVNKLRIVCALTFCIKKNHMAKTCDFARGIFAKERFSQETLPKRVILGNKYSCIILPWLLSVHCGTYHLVLHAYYSFPAFRICTHAIDTDVVSIAVLARDISFATIAVMHIAAPPSFSSFLSPGVPCRVTTLYTNHFRRVHLRHVA